MQAYGYDPRDIRHRPFRERRGGWEYFARLLLWATRNSGAESG